MFDLVCELCEVVCEVCEVVGAMRSNCRVVSEGCEMLVKYVKSYVH